MRYLGLVIALFLGGCSQVAGLFSDQPVSKEAKKEYKSQKQADLPKQEKGYRILYINAKNFRYYDYVTYGINKKQEITLELFAAGKTIGVIEITKKKICILNDCARKWPTAKNFFGKVSYGDLFDDIFMGRDIFDGIGKIIQPNGVLIQRFQKGGEIIYYERSDGHILFKNMSNGVSIALDKYVEQKVKE